MKITKYIPDTITSMNLLCGVVGVVFAFKGRFDLAFPLMLAASVFDFLDGMAARLLDAYSDMGKELDSLADLVSFGVLPAVMLFNLMKACTFSETVWCYVPLVIVIFSALRLAKFNVDDRQHSSFIGLPTPSCAMICGSLCYFIAYESDSFLATWAGGNVFIPALAIVLSFLLVCNLPMFSIKISKNDEKILIRKRIAMLLNAVIVVAIVAIVGLNWSMAVLLTFVVYVLMNVVFWLARI